ncbi:MAG TPA: hypothetical protein VGL81_18990 [Polyangiaceae bacterium]
MTRVGTVLAALVVAGAGAGCVLVTGDSEGYSQASGHLSGEGCQTPADCNGQPCCLVLSDAGVPSLSCEPSCPAYEQSCAVGSDCGDGGDCLSQSCTVEGTTATVTTCGAIPFCTQ